MEIHALPMNFIATVDSHGNTTTEKVLRTPLNSLYNKDEKILLEESVGVGYSGCRSDGDVDNQWAMTKDEKTIATLEELTDAVWNMVAQNYDFIECSQALRS
ncbi:hypothetical protein TELCIR_16309 [Teladorsagia circumcincta]|uniref:Uncharacterized protein n=1 Tax=Teladorsagia circumcincta TaxID=45464 RepID=A0A2G9TW33_TELCI|nr:hypothetical protein TELCIR_16309 [Teladorsagia circumcincta]